jgi:mono/diheme cytochrome c family protein
MVSASARASAAAAASVVVTAFLGIAAPLRAQEHPGKPVYDRWCAECHGLEGRGDGAAAAYMLPRPRDFTQARYQIRTTASGALPTDADLHRIIERGMPGTAMPGWPKLSRRDRDQVIAYIKTFSRFFETEGTPTPLSLGRAPGGGEDRIAEGRQVYEKLECFKCHGSAGRGDGQSAPETEDDAKNPIRPANLTQSWRFNGGGTVEDIYTRMRTGLDGTPMPSFSDALEANVVTEDELWSVAHYVRSLSPEKEPVAREVIRATRAAGPLPDSPEDEAWERVPLFYVPLVGQIVARPRWFAPTVNSVWVQALHDGEELALRLSWDDPSRSPDAVWDLWRTRVAALMEPKDDVALPAAQLPDAFAVQFPQRAAGGRDLPYFLMGDARTPVYLWVWNSSGPAHEALARGLGRVDPLPADGAPLRAQAVFADGRWQLVLKRALAAQDTARRLTFPTAEPVPIAFYAWDGSNNETGNRMAISSWYFVHLEQPATASIYVVPALAALLTAGLALLAVGRAQQQHTMRSAAPHSGEPRHAAMAAGHPDEP